MGFNFNQFFGYEKVINQNPDLVLIYGFGSMIFGIMALTLLAIICRKLSLIALIDHFLAPLICAFGLSLMIAILPTVIFKVVANDLSGVKLVYIWMAIFLGMVFFCFLNYPMIKKRMTTGA